MAVYHLSMQIISRSKGQSAVASAAYRSGEKLIDERTEETKFYVRKVEPETMILTPENSPEWVQDRNRLWNEVEKIEKRKDSQLAREMNIALPRELSNEQQKELIKGFVQNEFVNKGMIADISIHRDDKENPHAHIMLTTRGISKEGFTVKNTDWNNRELLNHWREQWANYANKALEKEGIQERISHLSHEARGMEQLPTVHLGHVAHEMERKGIKTERGNINRERQEYNRLVIDLEQYRKEKEILEKRIALGKQQQKFFTPVEKVAIKKADALIKSSDVTLDKIEERLKQIKQWENNIDKSVSLLKQKTNDFENARILIDRQERIESQIEQEQNNLKNIRFNPFKSQERDGCKEKIGKLQREHDFNNKQLVPYQAQLEFSTKEQFYEKARDFKEEREKQISSIDRQRQEAQNQKRILTDADNTLKQGEIREITSQYPELKNTGEYMNYDSALKLNEINKVAGKMIPLEQIKADIHQRRNEIEKRVRAIDDFNKQKQNVSIAGKYFNELNTVKQKIEKIENNPFSKGKLRISKEAKKEFDQLKQQQEHYKLALKNLGYENKETFMKDKAKIQESVPKLPVAEQQIKDLQAGSKSGISLGLLEGALQGVEQAKRLEERKRQSKVKKQHYKNVKQREGRDI